MDDRGNYYKNGKLIKNTFFYRKRYRFPAFFLHVTPFPRMEHFRPVPCRHIRSTPCRLSHAGHF